MWKTYKEYNSNNNDNNKNDIDRLYVSRKEGGRGLASIEDTDDALIQKLKDYIKKCWRRLITVTRTNTDNTSINRTKIIRKLKWEEKQMYGHFKQQPKYQARKLGHCWERKTLLEKMNFFK